MNSKGSRCDSWYCALMSLRLRQRLHLASLASDSQPDGSFLLNYCIKNLFCPTKPKLLNFELFVFFFLWQWVLWLNVGRIFSPFWNSYRYRCFWKSAAWESEKAFACRWKTLKNVTCETFRKCKLHFCEFLKDENCHVSTIDAYALLDAINLIESFFPFRTIEI